MWITFIICTAIIFLFGITAGTFIWFISYDKSISKRKFNEKIKDYQDRIDKQADDVIEKNIEVHKAEAEKWRRWLKALQDENKMLREKESAINSLKEKELKTESSEIELIEEDE